MPGADAAEKMGLIGAIGLIRLKKQEFYFGQLISVLFADLSCVS